MTNLQRLTITLTVVNLILLAFGVAQLHPAGCSGSRSGSFGLVHWKSWMTKGRVRAEIKVLPAQPTLKMPDGTTGYPEAVQLRLISSQNSPNVKLVTTEDGSGLVLGGEKGHTQAAIARRMIPSSRS